MRTLHKAFYRSLRRRSFSDCDQSGKTFLQDSAEEQFLNRPPAPIRTDNKLIGEIAGCVQRSSILHRQ